MSALTCQRFGRLRPVAAPLRGSYRKNWGVKPPKTKAVTGHRTAMWMSRVKVD
jgi:hypothetical protein